MAVLLEAGVSFVEGVLIAVVAGVVLYLLGGLLHVRTRIKQWQWDRRQWLPKGVTIEHLCALRAGKTEVVGDRVLAPYLGKWTRYGGTVTNVTKEWSGFKVSCQKEKPNLFLYFRGSGKGKHVALLPIGSEINVIGRVYMVFDGFMSLNSCELIED